jgi:DNA-binding NtrC family response regulator
VSKKILSVSYDEALLTTRQRILESQGYTVTSAQGVRDALRHCKSTAPFDVFILGHSIPREEKETLIEQFRAHRPAAAVVALRRAGEGRVRGADLAIEPNPRELLDAIANLLSGDDRQS